MYDDLVHSELTTVSQFVPSIFLSAGTQTFLISKLGGWKHISVPYIVRDEPPPDAQTPWIVLVLWKLVSNWQQRRTMDLLELG